MVRSIPYLGGELAMDLVRSGNKLLRTVWGVKENQEEINEEDY